MARPIGKTFVEISVDSKKYEKGIVDVKTTTKKKLSEIEKAWKGMGKKSEATIDKMKAKINKDYDTIKRHASSTADDIVRAEKAKNAKIARLNKQQFGEQKSLLTKLKKHWMLFSAAAIAAIYAIGRGLKTSLSEFAGFETALVDMGKVTSESFESIKKRIRELPPEIGTSTDLVKGYYQVISAGITDPVKAIDLLTTASKMGKAAHVDTSEVIKGLTKVMAGYEGEIKTTIEAADLLYTIEKEGQTSVAELIPVIGGLAKISHDAGISANEMGAALAVVSKTAGSTSEAATRYQAVVVSLMRQQGNMTKAVKELGYESAITMVKELGLAETLKKLQDTSIAAESGLMKLYGRQEAMIGASAILAEKGEIFNKTLDSMKEKLGAADKAWEDYRKTLNAILDTFKNIVTNQFMKIGEVLAPDIKKVVERAGEWFQANQDIITQDIATVVRATATAVRGLAKAYMGVSTAINSMNKRFEEAPDITKFFINMNTAGGRSKLVLEAISYWWDKAFGDESQEKMKKSSGATRSFAEETSGAADEVKKLAEELEEVLWVSSKQSKKLSYDLTLINYELEIFRLNSIIAWEAYNEGSEEALNYTKLCEQGIKATAEAEKMLAKEVATVVGAIKTEMSDLEKWIERFNQSFADSVHSTISDVFYDTFRGELKTFKDYWKAYWDSMLRIFADFAAKLTIKLTLEQLFGVDAGGETGTGLLGTIGKAAYAKYFGGAGAGAGAGAGTSWGGVGIATGAGASAGAGAGTGAGMGAGATAIGIGGVAAYAYLMYKHYEDVERRTEYHNAVLAAYNASSYEDKARWLQKYVETTDQTYKKVHGIEEETWEALATLRGEDIESTKEYFTIVDDLNRASAEAQKGYGKDVSKSQEAVYANMKAATKIFVNEGQEAFDRYYKGWKARMFDMIKEQSGGMDRIEEEHTEAYRTMTETERLWKEAGLLNVEEFAIQSNINLHQHMIDPALESFVNMETDFGRHMDNMGRDWSNFASSARGGVSIPITYRYRTEGSPPKDAGGGTIPSYQHGGVLPYTGLFYGHKGEEVRPKEEIKGDRQPLHVHLNLNGKEIGLAIIKDGDVIQQMDYQLTKRNKRVYA